jgi:hypothetical protein
MNKIVLDTGDCFDLNQLAHIGIVERNKFKSSSLRYYSFSVTLRSGKKVEMKSDLFNVSDNVALDTMKKEIVKLRDQLINAWVEAK